MESNITRLYVLADMLQRKDNLIDTIKRFYNEHPLVTIGLTGSAIWYWLVTDKNLHFHSVYAYLEDSTKTSPLADFYLSDTQTLEKISHRIVDNTDGMFDSIHQFDQLDPNQALRTSVNRSSYVDAPIPRINVPVYFYHSDLQLRGRIRFQERNMKCIAADVIGKDTLEESRRILNVQIFQNDRGYTQREIVSELASMTLSEYHKIKIMCHYCEPDTDGTKYQLRHGTFPLLTYSRNLSYEERFARFFSNYFRRALDDYEYEPLRDFVHRPVGIETKEFLDDYYHGYILHGPTGVGKTSFIHRWAAYLNRSVVYINIDVALPIRALVDEVRRYEHLVPSCIFVFEEFDKVIEDVVKTDPENRLSTESYVTSDAAHSRTESQAKDAQSTRVRTTLQDILKFIDGQYIWLGGLFVATTNRLPFIEQHAHQVVRPGRLTPIHFDEMQKNDLYDLCLAHFTVSDEEKNGLLSRLEHVKVSPATAKQWRNRAKSVSQFVDFLVKHHSICEQ